MTAIAGMVDEDGSVVIGADSASTGGCRIIIPNESKIVRFHKDFIAGFAGSVKASQAIKLGFTPPQKDTYQSSERYLFNVLKHLKTFCDEHWLTKKDKDDELNLSNIHALFGIAGKLFVVYPDMSFEEPACGYAGAGCADDLIRGALFVGKQNNYTAWSCVELALMAAAEFNIHVREPFHIENLL